MQYKSIKDLPLKLFFQIAESGDLKLLGFNSEAESLEVWEKIILEYSKFDGNQSIQNVYDKGDELFKQAALYCEIKAMLLYLVAAQSQEYIDRLKNLGYAINDKTHKEKIESIKICDARANHISTKMQIIQGEIDMYSSEKKASFDLVMVWLSTELGFEVKDDINVLRFLEYKKMIKLRQKKVKS